MLYFYIHKDNIHLEGTVSQIFDSGLLVVEPCFSSGFVLVLQLCNFFLVLLCLDNIFKLSKVLIK